MRTGGKDYYRILGVSDTVGADELKKVYRKLAMQYHPDRNPGNKAAETKFKEISEAYYVLSDPARRRQYDQMRRFGGSTADFAGAQGFNFEELLRQFAGGRARGGSRYAAFGDIFEDLASDFGFGTRGGRARHGAGRSVYEFFSGGEGPDATAEAPPASADVVVNLRISRDKARAGGRVTFRTSEGKTLSVSIPAGTRPDQRLRLARQGRTCPTCRHPGDLILQVRIET